MADDLPQPLLRILSELLNDTEVGFGPPTLMILEFSELDHIDHFRRQESGARSSDSLDEDNLASSELGITQATDSMRVILLPYSQCGTQAYHFSQYACTEGPNGQEAAI